MIECFPDERRRRLRPYSRPGAYKLHVASRARSNARRAARPCHARSRVDGKTRRHHARWARAAPQLPPGSATRDSGFHALDGARNRRRAVLAQTRTRAGDRSLRTRLGRGNHGHGRRSIEPRGLRRPPAQSRRTASAFAAWGSRAFLRVELARRSPRRTARVRGQAGTGGRHVVGPGH